MKASEAKLLDFLKKSPQFVIPIYQRTYSWQEAECEQLWNDILRAGRDDSITVHFVGSIVYVQDGLFSVSGQTPLLVIDGQQRLTTLTLLLEALARCVGDNEPVDGFSALKLRNYYLLNPYESGQKRFKLLLSQTDKMSLIGLLNNQPLSDEHSLRISENFRYFARQIELFKDEIQAICMGIAKLVIVDISLDRDHDNPQLIFESLNSTGLELSQADLIRNFVLMGLRPDHQSDLYMNYWRPMELSFGQEAYAAHFDAFIRHYLTVKTGDIPNINEVYKEFKKYARSSEAQSIDDIVKEVHEYSRYFCAIALDAETDAGLDATFRDIRVLKVDVAYPLLLELYKDYTLGCISRDQLLQILRWIESYVFRRVICNIPTNSLNKTFAAFARTIDKDSYLESVRTSFHELPSYRRFPDDDEFRREIRERDLYNSPRRSYWLRCMENHDRKEIVYINEYTIEHIMPQNENLSDEWKRELGPEWERIHQTYLHTLGNLTLTGYNSELSDKPFEEKRDMQGGFKDSPIRMNHDLAQQNRWDESAILQRAAKLADNAVMVWPSPFPEYFKATVSRNIWDRDDKPGYGDGNAVITKREYSPSSSKATGYTINDHPQLVSGKMKDLFQVFRQRVLSLDPAVTEDFVKYWVSFKADTSIVDVVPQAKQLVLVLDMDIMEIYDPNGICEDITGKGHWGKGNIRFGLKTIDELPYAMRLVRQSFEKQQMSDGGTD